MRKIIILLFIIFSGCCKERFAGTFLFTDFERSLIPYTTASIITFKDQNGNSFNARTQPFQIERTVMDNCADCCEDIEIESAINRIRFNNNILEVSIFLKTTEFGTEFRISYEEIDQAGSMVVLRDWACITEYTEGPLEDYLIETYEIFEFQFNNVLVLNDCNSAGVNAKLDQIVLSRQYGIELLGFKDGSYLVLQQ